MTPEDAKLLRRLLQTHEQCSPQECAYAEAAARIEALAAEVERLRKALDAIAAHSGKTLISCNPDEMWQRGYSEGAHNGFNNCAAIAAAALAAKATK